LSCVFPFRFTAIAFVATLAFVAALAFTGALADAGAAHAEPPSNEIAKSKEIDKTIAEAAPEEIAETIAEAAQVCRDRGGTADTTAVLRGDDLNGDGSNDWIADFSKVKCTGAENPACSPNGCLLKLYFWNGDGWDVVFEDFVRGFKFSSSGDTRTMHVTTYGAPCNKPQAESCTYNYRLEKDAVRPVQ